MFLNSTEKSTPPAKKEEKPDSESAELKKQLETEKKKAEEYLNNWKRAMADFENYKKRQSELFAELVNSASAGLIMEILPIYDTFCMAVKHIPENIKDKDWVKGVVQLKEQLDALLKSRGLKEIKSIGEKFNPEFHEAIEMVESEKPESEILEEAQKGYKLNGVVIRTAKVKVAALRR
ncbi:nucleotide exchange factor GrpE [Patescibacteria group bacterium]|nr:nucleotide exchange factor GrpE [Patescibacteria group bacterium]MBU4000383.1 nucleotide exchange factor GrpE [Patescibacteria group bacterium]MBU4057011.1 nucleotide exchange factor GrpE [Patescibacteria group bacterium]MBU4368617.1 nucleotide exchange factor GrpE [Patescibacteria group bacterium]